LTTKSNITKKVLIEALEKSLGIVTIACKNVDIARSTFYKWYKEDSDFAKEVDSIGEMAIDFAESNLHKQIKDGIPSSTIFYLKTKGKHRGYIEKHELVTDVKIILEDANHNTQD